MTALLSVVGGSGDRDGSGELKSGLRWKLKLARTEREAGRGSDAGGGLRRGLRGS
jgi:hypothetical protein